MTADRIMAAVVFTVVSGVVWMGAGAKASEPVAAVEFGRPEIVPAPQEMSFESNVVVRLDENCVFDVTCPDPAAGKWISDHAESWFGLRFRVNRAPIEPEDVRGPEGYRLSAAPGRIAIAARGMRGVRYALMVLRQAALPVSGGITVSGYWMPAMKVADSPALAFRGIHVCWFPETSATLVERMIRLAGYYRMNTVVLENWGTFRSERHPWWGWKDGKMTKAEIRRLKAIADDLGVMLVPQFNIFGHASLSRVLSGKHAVIDLAPEYQPLYEPDGWNWCLSNPDALRTIRELVVEMHEAFGSPPYFHIGCDEANEPGCPVCRAVHPYAKLVERHIHGVRDVLKARGAQAMMWHDMLLDRTDAQWKPFYANGSKDEAALLDRLPRDIVICDWYYGSNCGGRSGPQEYRTLAHFQKLGFPTLTCPWNDMKGTALQGAYAVEHGLLGVLGTTWHHCYKRELPRDIFVFTASAAWGTPARTAGFGRHWRQMGYDVKVKDYGDTGFVNEQVPSCTNIEIKPGG